jgi:hypothetical protein
MRKVLLLMLFIGSLFGMIGCGEKNKIVVKKPVAVFTSRPTKIKDENLIEIGQLNPGEEWEIKSVRYEKDFAVYEVDLSGSSFDVESGYLYFDSRYFDVEPVDR